MIFKMVAILTTLGGATDGSDYDSTYTELYGDKAACYVDAMSLVGELAEAGFTFNVTDTLKSEGHIVMETNGFVAEVGCDDVPGRDI